MLLSFKELVFSNKRYNGQILQMKMFVPGINSGAYDKSLHIEIRIIETIQKMFKKEERRVFSELTLTKEQVEQLRDECNKILELQK